MPSKRDLEEESELEEDLNAKRQKLLSDLVLAGEELCENENSIYIDDGANFKCLKYDDLKDKEYDENCYACEFVNNDSLRDNEDFLYMIKIYTDNIGNVSRESLFRMVKDHFDKYCKPYHKRQCDDCKKKESENEKLPENCLECKEIDWTLESIREHFDFHTNYPTDEINKQLNINKRMRNFAVSSAIYKKGDEIKLNNKNIKDILAIQREIRELMMIKGKINQMIGYSEILDY